MKKSSILKARRSGSTNREKKFVPKHQVIVTYSGGGLPEMTPKDEVVVADLIASVRRSRKEGMIKAKIEPLGTVKKVFPPRGGLQLFQLDKPATFFCTVRKVEVTSGKVALDLRTGELLSNGAYGQLLAGK